MGAPMGFGIVDDNSLVAFGGVLGLDASGNNSLVAFGAPQGLGIMDDNSLVAFGFIMALDISGDNSLTQ